MTTKEFDGNRKALQIAKERIDRDIVRLQKISSMMGNIKNADDYNDFEDSIDRIFKQLEVVSLQALV